MSHPGGGPPVLEAANVSKTFAGKTVLRGLDLDVRAGEVHGLVGQNGSGKSTFIKILSGFHAPDAGARIRIDGNDVALPIAPGQPRSLGISFVHQDLALADTMTVLDNLRVGRYDVGAGWRIRWSSERRRVQQALDDLGLDVRPDDPISSLSEVEAAMVAIIRALEQPAATGRGLLVLDEPTAYLPRDGVDRLFAGVRRAAASGVAVVFVSHRLDEVRAICDRVTVLRDGERVATAAVETLSEDALIAHILGRELTDLYPDGAGPRGDARLEVINLRGAGVHDFSCTVGAGEIVGLTGLVGMGFETVPYLLFGAQRADAGRMVLDGAEFELAGLSPRAAIARGLALLPANRQRYGGVAEATITENATLPTVGEFFAGGLLRKREERRVVQDVLDEYDVRPAEPRRSFGTLSGGNQQKVLVAKWFRTEPSALLLHEPTQGVDVGARRQIFARIDDAARAGKSVLIASSEYEDLANLCDRVYVLRDGRVVAELSGTALTETQIVESAFREVATAPADPGAGRA